MTASARADSVRESLAGQQSEIHSAGPEPERATVTVKPYSVNQSRLIAL